MKRVEPGLDRNACLERLTRAAQMLRVMAHADRLYIMQFLKSEEWAPVYRISEALGLPHAATSQHLNHMKRVGLLRSERHAKEVWYAIADHELVNILECICHCAQ
jgi:DNA-binding transcriptional ArsR family regulator